MQNEVWWVDDAAGYMLAPIARMLRRKGLQVRVFESYKTAMAQFDSLEETNERQGRLPHVLLDLLVPHADQGTLDTVEVGFTLARRCAALGIKKVVFLTVVSRSRVAVALDNLRGEFPETEFRFLGKTISEATRLVSGILEALEWGEEKIGES